MTSALYQQVPLPTPNSIRLLERCPTEQKSDKVTYLLKAYHHDHVPQYTTLSYTWGSSFGDEERRASHERPDNTYTIICNGFTVGVTQSLYEFLEAFAALQPDDGGSTTRLWIDAVCMNQSDLAEKSIQVQRMDKVYSNADETVIWLGPGSQIDRQAPWLFGEYTSKLRALLGEDFPTGPTAFTLSIPDLLNAGIENPLDYVEPFTYFFLRNWFSRAWIVQEVSLSKKLKVLCGSHLLEWADIVDLSLFINYNIISGGIKFEMKEMEVLVEQMPCFRYLGSIRLLRTVLHSPSGPLDIMDEVVATYCAPEFLDSLQNQQATMSFFIMNQLRKFDCQDPRDKIYASVGLMSALCSALGGGETSIVKVDYEQPKQFTYTSAVSSYLKSCPSLLPLYYVGDLEDRLSDGLPSWVTNFSTQTKTRVIQFHRGFNASRWTGGPNSGGRVVGQTLKVFAKRLGSVSKTNMKNRDLMNLQMYHGPSKLQKLLDMCQDMSPTYSNGQGRMTALWRTAVMNTEWDSAAMPTDYPARDCVESAFRKWLLTELSAMFALIEAVKRGSEIDNETYHELAEDASNLEAYSAKYKECLQSLETLRSTETSALLPSIEEIQSFSTSPAVASRLAGAFPSWIPSQDEGSASENPDTFSYNFHQTISSRKLFSLQGGLVGIGPEDCRKEDEVWIFRDARLPFVLRSSSESGAFQLIGDCYVHGVMNGEAVTDEASEFHEITLK